MLDMRFISFWFFGTTQTPVDSDKYTSYTAIPAAHGPVGDGREGRTGGGLGNLTAGKLVTLRTPRFWVWGTSWVWRTRPSTTRKGRARRVGPARLCIHAWPTDMRDAGPRIAASCYTTRAWFNCITITPMGV